jgi:hypothetical protein
MNNLQTLKVTTQEATILIIVLTGSLVKLEEEYKRNKEDESFYKEDALSEINSLKGLLKKVGKLEVFGFK